ncbi:MAG: imidazolonepropionase [Betaproteobacteria bacterium]|nr:imidazolonepropionase [Betaproteobacteria bacterium]
MWDVLWLDAQLATLRADRDDCGEVRDGAIGIKDGRIAWVGPRSQLPGEPRTLAKEIHEAGGAWITPGLIDCHTHLVYGGNRAREFELRLLGASYEEIARAGGGIVSTVRATREASDHELTAGAARRLAQWLDEGVTVIEVKSGYGLDAATEIRLLRIARLLGSSAPVTVRTTFLGAHALPPEFAGRADAYVDCVCDEMLPAVAQDRLADAVDAFCEKIAFSPEQTARVFEAARRLGLRVKLHADQLSDCGGAQLAAGFGALSADHLEYSNEEGVAALAAAGTVAVLLPGAFYFLREKKLPPVEALRRHRVPIAVATDHNPGSSPLTSILLTLNLSCTLFRLTPAEALAGVTRNAARALGMHDTHGTLEAGKQADLAFWRIESPAELGYAIGGNPCERVVRAGELVRAMR